MKTKKTKKMTILDFINGCKNKTDIIYFNDPNDAYNYGKKVRENIEIEKFDNEIIVDISGNTVRIKAVAEEPIYVGSGCV